MYTFPDGAHYRIEVSGIERAWMFKKLAEEFKKAGVPWHRAICCVRGAGAPRENSMMNGRVLCGFYEKEELREFAKIGAEYGIEVIMTPFMRPMYQDCAIQSRSPQGLVSGASWRGNEGVWNYVQDLLYLYDLGLRGFLIWRKGLLSQLHKCCYASYLPRDIVLKLSVFDGNANPADAELVKNIRTLFNSTTKPIMDLTMNPTTDLTIKMLGELRQVCEDMPLDVHSRIFESWGGNNRIHEAHEIVKAVSPVYFKDEPGPGLEMYLPHHPAYDENKLWKYKQNAIEAARQIIENINRDNEKYGTDFKISGWGPKDLRLPKIN